jgi:hypothetical protein
MKRRLGLLLLILLGTSGLIAAEQWTPEKATAWYGQQPWLIGCNFAPSTAINQLEMWQADTFDLATVDRESGWAQSVGFTSIRVFLHDLLWKQDSQGLLSRMDQFLAVADKHHIGVMFVIFDGVWDPHPQLGRQRAPRPHVHNSGWVRSPGADILKDPSEYDSLKPYVQGVLRRFTAEPPLWHHDIFRKDGTPYNLKEVEYIKALTGKNGK